MNKLDKVDLFSIFLCVLTVFGLLISLAASTKLPGLVLVMGISGLLLDGILTIIGLVQKKYKFAAVYFVVTVIMGIMMWTYH